MALVKIDYNIVYCPFVNFEMIGVWLGDDLKMTRRLMRGDWEKTWICLLDDCDMTHQFKVHSRFKIVQLIVI